MPTTRPRFATPRTKGASTYGPKVGQLAAVLGHRFMPSQQLLVDRALEHRGGTLLHRLVVGSAGRRSGKTESALTAITWRCLSIPGTQAFMTAQTRYDAVRTLLRFGERLMASPVAPLCHITRGAGMERVSFGNGSVLWVYSPLPDALHGRDVDVLLLDEPWTLTEQRGAELIAASVPAMATRAMPQLWLTSAAGTAESSWWESMMASARRSGVLVDYGLAADVEPTVANVARSHPAVGHTIAPEVIAQALETMPRDEWVRAFGNRATAATRSLFPAESWSRGASSEPLPKGAPFAVGLDVDADRSRAAVFSAHQLPDKTIVVNRVRVADGVAWVVPLLRKLVDGIDGQGRGQDLLAVAGEANGPAAPLLEALERERIADRRTDASPAGRLVRLTGLGWASACAALFDRVVDGSLRHRGDDLLDAAVAVAAAHRGRDSMSWSRSSSAGSICALGAVTAAVAGIDASARQLEVAKHGVHIR